MAMHRYTIDVEYNDNPAYHPITVTVERGGESRDFSGKSLPRLLAQATKHIIEEENGEDMPTGRSREASQDDTISF